MCLPYLKDKAESFSDTIVSNTPNGLIVLNEALEVQQINTAALQNHESYAPPPIFSATRLCAFLTPSRFIDVLSSGRNMRRQEHLSCGIRKVCGTDNRI